MNRAINFIKEAKTELKKVNWPTREQTIKHTLIVVGLSVVVALFLAVLDYFFGLGLKRFVE